MRVTSVHRASIVVTDGIETYSIQRDQIVFQASGEDFPTVGDWLLLRPDEGKLVGMLNRKTVFRRARVDNKSEFQLIAANIDCLFVLSSCDEEFNESRLERYLITANECDLATVLVLTKKDMCNEVEKFVARGTALPSVSDVVPIDARNAQSFGKLRSYFEDNKTVGLVGSSGVGKSTFVNSLLTSDVQTTRGTRKGRGRHTTTSRTLLRIPSGGLVVDVPGIREFGMMDVRMSIDELFKDIVELERSCRFANCRHDTEPGCAIKSALESGSLDFRRLLNYQKLLAEEAERTDSRLQRLVSEQKKPRIS